MNNVVVAYEALHKMKTRMRGKKGYMAIKLNMSKTYDRVEWPFLEAIMRKMGFTEHWIGLTMQCVTSVSYSVLINGTPYGKILPSIGLRQGDPLSLYLFFLCAEGLSSLLMRVEQDERIIGVPIAAKGFKLSHLFFADDSLLFCRANFSEWGQVINLLHKYELASGQKMNNSKTAIFLVGTPARNSRNLFTQM
jgi:hypothetical protein